MYADHTNGRYFGADNRMPTGPDVDALLKAFPALQCGDRIPYEAVTQVTGVVYPSRRFDTVAAAWMARLKRDARLVLKRKPGECFYVATPAQILASTPPTLGTARRQITRQKRSVATIQDPTDAGRREKLHHLLVLSAAQKSLTGALRQALPTPAVQPPPQIGPPCAADKPMQRSEP